MKSIAILGATALAAFSFSPAHTGGPYVDSKGNVYDALPLPGGKYTVAEFDSRFAHEVFTDANGDQFQLDRALTPEELRRALLQKQLGRMLSPKAKRPGGGFRATVTTNHPCDEEFHSGFANLQAAKQFVIDFVELADNSMFNLYGINVVPTSGQCWDSDDGADINGLLSEAWSEYGRRGQDMMIAVSNDPTPGTAVGLATLGKPRCIIKQYLGLEENICEHEVGHNYTLRHCCQTKVCTMVPTLTPANFGSFHNSGDPCAGQNHHNRMTVQRNRY